MTVNHDVVGSSPTAGVLQPQLRGCGFLLFSKTFENNKKGLSGGGFSRFVVTIKSESLYFKPLKGRIKDIFLIGRMIG